MLSQHCFQGPEFVGHILFPAHVLAIPAHRTICSVRYIASQVHRTVKTLCPLWKAAHRKLEQKHKENAMLKLEPNTGNRTNHRIVFSAGCCLLLTVLKEQEFTIKEQEFTIKEQEFTITAQHFTRIYNPRARIYNQRARIYHHRARIYKNLQSKNKNLQSKSKNLQSQSKTLQEFYDPRNACMYVCVCVACCACFFDTCFIGPVSPYGTGPPRNR